MEEPIDEKAKQHDEQQPDTWGPPSAFHFGFCIGAIEKHQQDHGYPARHEDE